MGEENNLEEIHRNLMHAVHKNEAHGIHSVIEKGQVRVPDKGGGSETLTKSKTETTLTPTKPIEVGGGTQFYDPRRKERYWSTPKTHHQSYKAAIKALADMYGVSSQWIEEHMGDTNDLDKMHHNIRSALKGD